MNEVSLKPVIEELENLFSKFNARFFADKLEKPVITVSPDHTRGAYGWCTGWKAWKAGEDEGHYEINLCAEYLNRPFEETCGTLIHEMVHAQLAWYTHSEVRTEELQTHECTPHKTLRPFTHAQLGGLENKSIRKEMTDGTVHT